MLTITSSLHLTRHLWASLSLVILFLFYLSTAQAGSVSLMWNANTEPTIGGYKVYYGQASGNYTANVDVSLNTTYTLTNLLAGGTYYFAVKAYDSARTTESGFSNEVSTTIPATTAPIASFSVNPTSGTAPLLVNFTDTSTGSPTEWSWNFGDGTTAFTKTAVHTYSNPGAYTVSLTVRNSGGSTTATRSNYVSVTAAPPVANFSASPISGTAPLTVQFADTSAGAITGWSWNFGDGGTSPAQNPAHTYTTAGTYTVSLTTTGPAGSNTKTQNSFITVSQTGGGSSGTTGGPVAAYNFEEASGTTVVDASGKGNHGVITGAVRTTAGKFGKALSFDGVNDWVTINDSVSLDLTTGMTLEAWVKPTDDWDDWTNFKTWRTVVLKEQFKGATYYLYARADSNQPTIVLFIDGNEQFLRGGPSLTPNSWVHLAATYDGVTQRLYVNGIQVASRPQSRSIQVSNGVLRIGGNSVWGEFFKGLIDEVRIYNRALSAAEIEADMNNAVANTSPAKLALGTTAAEQMTDSNPQGTAKAFKTTAKSNRLATRLSVYINGGSTSTHLVVGLYSDNNGHPGRLLAQGSRLKPIADAWNRVPIRAISITAKKTYWIAVLSPTGVLQFGDKVGGLAEPCETSAETTLTSLPSAWTTGVVCADGPLKGYGAGY